ncbi:hypothetical protein LSH36_810g00016 [Paralvinella palmiformis]|uniref:thiopurine S-methyltransferase n=1 Tax=Paralvinella palmiformis TaxID=53620 RepID=A0AAD9IZY5_9ANNE|nr:hypothetical protein LSH36_810g00016 [Paralvinella palmiformis]
MSHDPADLDSWKKNWLTGQIGWHEGKGNRWLSSNINILTAGREKVKVFIPLCGKSKDIKCLADNGHDVVGVEVSPLALEQFFEENDIPFTVNPVPECNGSLYKSTDGKIQLYCCSIFDFNRNVAGIFDAVWDRGSMVALSPELLEKYQVLMESLMAPGCQYIFERLDYDKSGRSGSPHIVPMETLERLFGSKCNIEVIDKWSSPKYKEIFKVDFFVIEMIRITWKSDSPNSN